MADSIEELKEKQVLAHRILTQNESMGDTTGHVWARIPGADEILTRCRNREDQSPGYVEAAAMHRIDFNGKPTEPMGDYSIPPERWIACSIMKMRPDVNCVIHAHPPAQVLCANAGIKIRPIVGAQNNGGAALARGGIGVYPRALLIHNREIAAAMLAVMGRKDVVLLKGHGNVVCGRSIEEATVRALQLESIARLTWQIALSGLEAPDVPWEDVEEGITRSVTGIDANVNEGGGGPQASFNYYVRLLKEGRSIIPDF